MANGRTASSRTIDISEGGMRIEPIAGLSLAVGASVDVESGGTGRRKAKVIRVDDGISLSFVA